MTRRARDVLIDILRDEGITHVFGNPGSTEMPLMDALVDAPDIAYVLGLQEATAVGMADGWALATGRTAFVNLHAMGGLGNAMGVLVASKASETPLVVTAGQQDTRHLMTEPWLSGDLVALAGAGHEMGEGIAPRRRRRSGAPPRLRPGAHAAMRPGVPVVADGHSRPGREITRRRRRPRGRGSGLRPTRRAWPRRSRPSTPIGSSSCSATTCRRPRARASSPSPRPAAFRSGALSSPRARRSLPTILAGRGC